MNRNNIGLILWAIAVLILFAVLATGASGQVVAGTGLTIGSPPTPPGSGSPVRIVGVPGTTNGVLDVNGTGDLVRRFAVKLDLPTTVVYTDQVNTFGAFLQTFGGGLTSNGLVTIGGTNDLLVGSGGIRGPSTTTGVVIRNFGDTLSIAAFRDAAVIINQPTSITGNSSVTGTFGVSAAFTASTSATVGTTLDVTGLSTLTGGFDSGANSIVTGTFGVSGLSTLTGGYNAGANSSIVGNLDLTGTGHVTAAGDIAVNGGDLTSTAATLNLNSGGIVNIQDRLTMESPNAAGAAGWASWTSGWNVSYGGSADFRHLQADELHVRLFIAELQEAHNGSEAWVKSSAIVDTAFVCPATAGGTVNIRVRDFPSAGGMRVFSASDWVLFKVMTRTDTTSGGGVANDGKTDLQVGECVGTVSAYVDGSGATEGTQQWTFTRGTLSPTSNPTGGSFVGTVPAEALALDFGVSNAGFLEATVNDGLEGVWGPYFQSVKWTGSPASSANGKTVTTRFGKLTGITTIADEYGFIAGLYGSNELGRYVKASNLGVDLHGVDFTLWDGANQAIILRRGAGSAPYIGIGNPAPTTYATGTGVWMGDDSGTYKFRIGNTVASGLSRLTWDGTTLNIAGTVTVTAAGGNILTNDASSAGTWARGTTRDGNAVDTTAVNGVASATVQGGAARANTGLNTSGSVILPVYGANITSTTAVTGLNMTSTHMGYYNGGAVNGGWPVLIQSNGTFYAGNATSYVSWNGTTLSVNGTINVTGGNAETTTGAQAKADTKVAEDGGTFNTGTISASTTITSQGLQMTSVGQRVHIGSVSNVPYPEAPIGCSGGVWMGYWDVAPADARGPSARFCVGNSTNYLSFDGYNIRLRGGLNADDITAGTITGRTFRSDVSMTGPSGSGLWMDASSLYVGNGSQYLRWQSGVLSIVAGNITMAGSLYLYTNSLNIQTAAFNISNSMPSGYIYMAAPFGIRMGSLLAPWTDGGVSLGQDGLRFGGAWLNLPAANTGTSPVYAVVGGGTGLGEGQLAYIVGFSGTCAGTASLVVKAGVIISCP